MQLRRSRQPGEVLVRAVQGVVIIHGVASNISIDATRFLNNDLLRDVVPDLARLVGAGTIGTLRNHCLVDDTIRRAEITDREDDDAE